jgi:hypothetical protein
VKDALSKGKEGSKEICAVYGLPTVFTGALLLSGLLLLQVLSLLQGSKSAPALAIMFFASLLLLLAIAVARLNSIVMAGELHKVGSSKLCWSARFIIDRWQLSWRMFNTVVKVYVNLLPLPVLNDEGSQTHSMQMNQFYNLCLITSLENFSFDGFGYKILELFWKFNNM